MPVEIVTTLMENVEQTDVIRFVLKAEPATGAAVLAASKVAATGRPTSRPGV
jgi:hypothetical protein